MKAKLPVTGGMRVDAFSILERCISEGVRYGLARSYKYNDNPDDEVRAENIEREVMNSICEYFQFDQPEDP